MRYLGLVAAIVVMVCVFAYVMRLPSTSSDLANSNSYAATVNAVRNAVKTAAGAEQRRRWAIAQQLKASDPAREVTYNTDGDDAQTLVVVSGLMNSTQCSIIADGEIGRAAAAIGFTSINCRTLSGGTVFERDLP